MSTGIELLVIDEWVTTTLLGDGTLTALLGRSDEVYTDTIPDGVVYPYVMLNMMANGEAMTTDQTIVLVTADYQIKGVDRAASYASLKPIAQRIHTLLHKKSGTVTDGLVLKASQIRGVHYPEITETVHYRHLGGVYRFWVEGA